MDETTAESRQSLEQLVRRVRQKDLSRGHFIALLTGLGASATGIATLLASAESTSVMARPPQRAHSHTNAPHPNTHLHEAHVRRQGTLTHGIAPTAASALATGSNYRPSWRIMRPRRGRGSARRRTYRGQEAIAARKLAEMQGMRGVTIDVAQRFAHHNQIVAEWVLRPARGRDLRLPATGRQIECGVSPWSPARMARLPGVAPLRRGERASPALLVRHGSAAGARDATARSYWPVGRCAGGGGDRPMGTDAGTLNVSHALSCDYE
jgi:hypothetical protein